jgi:hypothetical protein
MAEFDRTKSIQRFTEKAFERVFFDASLSGNPLPEIKCGVIFVHAFWAGSSGKTLAALCESISRIDSNNRLRFIVCDIDEIPPLDPALYGGDSSGGNGDVFWISNGRVIGRHTASRSCDFDTANQSLLERCSASKGIADTIDSITLVG